MTITHLRQDQYPVSRWSGGITKQIAIAPADAVYGERSFLWRVSSATVDLEESQFTPLPDYQRWITTLEGSVTLTHDGGAPIHLEPYEIHQFDGGSATCSRGRCTDFNLMLRKGRYRGGVRTVRFFAAGEKAVFSAGPGGGAVNGVLLLYCCSGGGSLTGGGGCTACSAGESILVENLSETSLTLTADRPAVFLIAEIEPVSGPDSHS